MTVFEEYYSFTEKYTEFYREVLKSEYNKYNALLSNDLEQINQAMKEYQSCVKQVQKYEQERIDLCIKLGFKDMAFSSIVQGFDENERIKLTEQKNELTQIIENVRYLNKKSIEYANMQVSFTTPADSTVYNARGETGSPLAKSSILNRQA